MERIGLIDIGSNTVRLCIYEINQNTKKFKILINTKESVRLRMDVVDNKLSEVGIQKLFNVLSEHLLVVEKYDLDMFLPFATQTIRMVDNRDEILQRVKDKFDLDIRILSKDEESLFGFNGMHQYLKKQRNGIYVDLGGGSTEVVFFQNGIPVHMHSFDFGSIVLRNMISHAVPTNDDMAYLSSFLLDQFDQISWLRNLRAPLVVTGGSSRNLVRIDAFITKRRRQFHGYRIGFREIKRTRKLLMLLTLEEIEKIDGFSSHRADIIIPSIFVFESLFKYTQADYYVCSTTGLREGVILHLLGE